MIHVLSVVYQAIVYLIAVNKKYRQPTGSIRHGEYKTRGVPKKKNKVIVNTTVRHDTELRYC